MRKVKSPKLEPRDQEALDQLVEKYGREEVLRLVDEISLLSEAELDQLEATGSALKN